MTKKIRECSKTYTAFTLSHMGVTDEDAEEIAEAIAAKGTTITSLMLTNNVIGDRGAIAIASAAEKSRTLTALHMSGNRVGAAGRHALCAVLAKSGCALKKLEVGTIEQGQMIDYGRTGLWINESRGSVGTGLKYNLKTYNNFHDGGTGESVRVSKIYPIPAPLDPHQDSDYPDADHAVEAPEDDEEDRIYPVFLVVGDKVRICAEEPVHGWPGESVAREAAGVVTRLMEGEDAPDGGAIAYVTYVEEGVKNHPVLISELEIVECEVDRLVERDCAFGRLEWHRCDGDEFYDLLQSRDASPLGSPREAHYRNEIVVAKPVAPSEETEFTLRSLPDAQALLGVVHMEPLLPPLLDKLATLARKCASVSLCSINLGPRDAASCCSAISGFRAITSLDLSGNPLGNAGAVMVSAALKLVTTLASLSLRSTHLTGPGARVLVETFTRLERLDLSKNYLSDDSARPILVAYANGSFTSVILDGTEVSDSMERALLTGCQNARGGGAARLEASPVDAMDLAGKMQETADMYRKGGGTSSARALSRYVMSVCEKYGWKEGAGGGLRKRAESLLEDLDEAR